MPEAASHKRRTLSGVIWNLLRVLGQTLLGLVSGIVLARLLSPEDFGLLALALVFIGIAEMISSVGMEPAIVQRRDLSGTHIRVAMTMSLIGGALLTLLFWALAHPISVFFKEPRIAEIIPVLAFGIGLTAATATSRGLLIRRMDFRTLFKIDLTASLVGTTGISITMAMLGYGVWSLVAGTVVSLVIQGVALAIVEPLRFPLCFSRQEVKELIGYGGEMSLNEIINYFARNVDYVVIGRYLEAVPLGLYSRAYNLAGMPVNKIAISLSGALFPSYSEVQNDREKLARGYLRTISATALVTFPILIGFIVCAELVVVGLLGERWRAATTIFQILAFSGGFKAIYHLAGAVAQATNNVRAEIWRQCIYLALLGLGAFLFVGYGIEAVGWVVVAASLWMYLSMAQLVGRIVGFTWGEFFRAQFPGIVLAMVVALVELPVLWINSNYLHWSEPLALFLVVVVSGLTCLLGFVYLPENLLGTTPAWIFQQFAYKLPRSVQVWIEKRFPLE
ncbi:MAG: lipopolysaccharide biosynthesis protein [Betaproteobacteria bacterium]